MGQVSKGCQDPLDQLRFESNIDGPARVGLTDRSKTRTKSPPAISRIWSGEVPHSRIRRTISRQRPTSQADSDSWPNQWPSALRMSSLAQGLHVGLATGVAHVGEPASGHAVGSFILRRLRTHDPHALLYVGGGPQSANRMPWKPEATARCARKLRGSRSTLSCIDML